MLAEQELTFFVDEPAASPAVERVPGRIESIEKSLEEKSFGTSLETAAASKWQAVQDDEGRTYYWNKDTGETTWEPPPANVT